MRPVRKPEPRFDGGDRQIRLRQKMRGFFHGKGQPIVIQAHPRIFIHNRIHIIAAVAQRFLQRGPGHAAVGILHEVPDARKQQQVGTGVELYAADVVKFFCIQVVEQMADKPFEHKSRTICGKHQSLEEPVCDPVQVREVFPVLVDRKKIQIILPFFQFNVIRHEPEDGIFLCSLFLKIGGSVLFQQLPDKIDRQADKKKPGVSDIFFHVEYILVDQAAGASGIQIIFVFQPLRDASLQDDYQLKKGVLVQGPGIELVKIRNNIGRVKIILIR